MPYLRRKCYCRAWHFDALKTIIYMTNCLYRFLVALCGLAPMSIAASGSDPSLGWESIFAHLVIAVCVCVIAALSLKCLFDKIRSDGCAMNVSGEMIVSVSQRREGLVLYFMSYIMPFFLNGSTSTRFWVFCIVILLVASFVSSGIANNPMLRLLGFKFYDVQMKSGITQLYITKQSPQQIIRGFRANMFESDVLIQKE